MMGSDEVHTVYKAQGAYSDAVKLRGLARALADAFQFKE